MSKIVKVSGNYKITTSTPSGSIALTPGAAGAVQLNGTVMTSNITSSKSITINSGTVTTIDSYAAASYDIAKYLIKIKDTHNNVSSIEILMAHDASNAYVNTFATIDTGISLGVVTANLSSGTVHVIFTPTNSTTMTLTVLSTYA